jgi:hypothetical protein
VTATMTPCALTFDRQIKLEFHGSTVTSDAGLLAYRELDDALQLTSTAATGLHDTHTGQNTQHSLLALLRQSIYSRLQASLVRRADRFRRLSPKGASRGVGSGREGVGSGSDFGRKSLRSHLRVDSFSHWRRGRALEVGHLGKIGVRSRGRAPAAGGRQRRPGR